MVRTIPGLSPPLLTSRLAERQADLPGTASDRFFCPSCKLWLWSLPPEIGTGLVSGSFQGEYRRVLEGSGGFRRVPVPGLYQLPAGLMKFKVELKSGVALSGTSTPGSKSTLVKDGTRWDKKKPLLSAGLVFSFR